MIVSSEHAVAVRGINMRSRTFIFGDNQQVAIALYTEGAKKYLRIQYGCTLGTAFGSTDCDCAQQITSAIDIISESGGILIYFRDHEAFGLGIFEKAEILAREQVSREAHERSLEKLRCSEASHSVIALVPEILSTIGAKRLVFLGCNKDKVEALRKYGVEIASTKPLPINLTSMTPFARDEITWKAARKQRSSQ